MKLTVNSIVNSLEIIKNEELNYSASNILDELLQEYKKNALPINVSFRKLVGSIPVNELTHSVYPYPARLLRQIPRFFLHCDQLIRPGDVVLDPFCGSGTVLVEAYAAQIIGWGIDKNPFARLLSRVKTVPLDEDLALQAATNVLERAKTFRKAAIPNVININFWFNPQVIVALARLRRAITEANLPVEIKQYLLVCLALTADRCSLRDFRIPVPVRRRDWQITAGKQHKDVVWCTFESIAQTLAKRLSTLPIQPNLMAIVEGEDAILAGEIYHAGLAARMSRPKLILTSPPYGAAQKYIRSTSLALGWTGLANVSELATLEQGLIGREHLKRHELANIHTFDHSLSYEISMMTKNPLRAAIYSEYFKSMDIAIENLVKLLLPGGAIVLVAGSNTVADHVLDTHYHLRDIAIRHGMTPILELRDTIRGRVLMTKRASTSRPLHFETVHVLRKDNET